MKQIFDFCQIVETQLQISNQHVALVVTWKARTVTKAMLLVGAYLILMCRMDIDEAIHQILPLSDIAVPFNDGKEDINTNKNRLRVEDCLRALSLARDLSWADFEEGGFDAEAYKHLDSPLNADMHEIVPGKLISMRGPRDLPSGAAWLDEWREDGGFSHRDFSPQHCAEILEQFGVRAVLRLNAPDYDAAGFRAAGIAVADVYFDDCSTPSVEVVAEFLTLAEGLPGALAVHCKAGLGRTGTLIAFYMMKHHGFTAREAIGWLRIVRPGSVIGPQQQFLCDKEALMWQCGDGFRRRMGGRRPAPACGEDLAAVEAYIAAVSGDIRSRAAALQSAAAADETTSDVEDPTSPTAAAAAAAAAELAAHVSSAADRRSGRRASVSLVSP